MKNKKRTLKNGLSATFAAAMFGAVSITATASQTWYVDASSGNDANNGHNAATALASIQRAIDSSGPGDRIIVNDGAYGAITSTNQLLTIESVNGAARTIIDASLTSTNVCAADLDRIGNSGVPTNTCCAASRYVTAMRMWAVVSMAEQPRTA